MTAPTPPRPPRHPKTIVQLGRERVDDYAWMKDDNWQAVLRDPSVVKAEVRAHLEAENAYLAAMLASTDELQARLFEEMKGRIKQDDASVPSPDGPFEYFSRYEAGAEHPRRLRRPRRGGGDETLLLDEAAEAVGKPYYAVDGGVTFARPCPLRLVGRRAGFGISPHPDPRACHGGRCFQAAPKARPGTSHSPPTRQWLFWVWRDENARPAKVFRRPARGGEDVLVYHEIDDGMFLGVGVTADDSHILIVAQNQETSEAHVCSGGRPPSAPAVVAIRQRRFALRPRPVGRPVGDPHQPGRRSRFPGDDLDGRDPHDGVLGTARRAPGGTADRRGGAVPGPSGVARAGECLQPPGDQGPRRRGTRRSPSRKAPMRCRSTGI